MLSEVHNTIITLCVCVCSILFSIIIIFTLCIFLRLTTVHIFALLGKAGCVGAACTFWHECPLVVLACESLHVCTACIWRCEHTRFCVEVFLCCI